VKVNTTCAVKLCSLEIILFVIGRHAVVVVDDSKCFTHPFTPCSESYQRRSQLLEMFNKLIYV